MTTQKIEAEIADTTLPPQAVMLQLLTGKWVSQAIYAAAELGIADLLAAGEQTAEELAGVTNTNADALYRLLRALSAVGVFAEGDNHQFRNTDLGETLRRNVPGSLRGFARLMGMEMTWKAWGEIVYGVRTGQCAFERVAGQSAFEYIHTRPGEAEIINTAMTSMSEVESQSVIDAYDFSTAHTIVDVGGGHGLLLAAILKANPHAKGILFELPHASEGAKQLFAKYDVAQRVDVVAGNALQSVCAGGDIYIMKHVIHDWDDDRSIQFMKNCAAAMSSGSKLLLVEMVLTPPNIPHFAKLLDLEMLIMSPGGLERTIDEYHRLYAAAGLVLTRTYPTKDTNSVIEGIKP